MKTIISGLATFALCSSTALAASINFSKEVVSIGDTFTLSWKGGGICLVAYEDNVTGEPKVEYADSGAILMTAVNPGSYGAEILCTPFNGSSKDSIRIIDDYPAPEIEFNASPQVNRGEVARLTWQVSFADSCVALVGLQSDQPAEEYELTDLGDGSLKFWADGPFDRYYTTPYGSKKMNSKIICEGRGGRTEKSDETIVQNVSNADILTVPKEKPCVNSLYKVSYEAPEGYSCGGDFHGNSGYVLYPAKGKYEDLVIECVGSGFNKSLFDYKRVHFQDCSKSEPAFPEIGDK